MSDGLYWVEHQELAYTPGRVIGETANVLKVICPDGFRSQIEKSKAVPVHRNSLAGVANLLDLGEFSMAALLHNIRVRYERSDIYSSIGLPILISVNPYTNLPHLYDKRTRNQYLNANFADNEDKIGAKRLPPGYVEEEPALAHTNWFIERPHLFGTAQMTFTSLVRTKEAQSIVISGESGAGKTEATKILLQYFSDLEGDNQRSSSIASDILNSNPVLEAFGNAKTVRNDNSSRFGRFIQLYFDLNHIKRIKCARISHYLLEKCRLVSLHENERNFHVFYHLLIGGRTHPVYSKKLHDWNLDQLENFSRALGDDPDNWYLGDEDLMFAELLRCMESVGISEEECEAVLSTIGGLVHLSNLEFVPYRESFYEYGNSAKAQVADIKPLELACELLGIRNIPNLVSTEETDPVKATQEVLLFKKIRSAEGQGQWIRTPRDPSHASQVRDSIVKEVYSRLFDWIIKRINHSLMQREHEDHSTLESLTKRNTFLSQTRGRKSSSHVNVMRNGSQPIGLLDIYGFEVFDGRNSFEQLCINFANEKLQHHFNQHVLALEQATYTNEEIDWSDVLFTDNLDIIKALEDPPRGVFVILDDTRVAERNRDMVFLQELERRAVKSVVKLPDKKCFRDTIFTVQHYAGYVDYCCTGFVEKNVDRLEAQSSYFLSAASAKPIIKELFANEHEDDLANKRNSLKATMGKEFRMQLDQLMASLTATTPTYVRCIKPNGSKKSQLFQSLEVLRQLEYAGLLESIRIRNSGFGVRCTFTEFLDDYCVILRSEFVKYKKRRGNIDQQTNRELCRRLLVSTQADTMFNRRSWQLGRSKVFMREEVQAFLEQARGVSRAKAAIHIQAYIRGAAARIEYRRRMKAIRKIQRLARLCLARYYAKLDRSASIIQQWFRYAVPTRKRFRQIRRNVIRIQIWWRIILKKRTQNRLHDIPSAANSRNPKSSSIAKRIHKISEPAKQRISVQNQPRNQSYGKITQPPTEYKTKKRKPTKVILSEEEDDDSDAHSNRRTYSRTRKNVEFNYEETFRMMFSGLTTSIRNSHKDANRLRQENSNLRTELTRSAAEIAKLQTEKTAVITEYQQRENIAVEQIEALLDHNDLLQRKLRSVKSTCAAIDTIFTELHNFAHDRTRNGPDCDLVTDCVNYIRNACSRGFDHLRSIIYNIENSDNIVDPSPRSHNPPIPSYDVPVRSLMTRISRITDEVATERPRHMHRTPRRNADNLSVYDEHDSTYGFEESARSHGRTIQSSGRKPSQPEAAEAISSSGSKGSGGFPYLRGTNSAYRQSRGANPYLQLGGKNIARERADGAWSSGSYAEGNSQFDSSSARFH